jgi:superfamily II DNA or RNA helicase
MAVTFKVSALSSQELDLIYKVLNCPSKPNPMNDFAVSWIACYDIKTDGKENTIAVPLSFARLFLLHHLTNEKALVYPRKFPQRRLVFQGIPRDYQVSVIREIDAFLAKHHTATVNCRTGFGKSVVTMASITKPNTTVTILVHREHVQNNWINSAKLCKELPGIELQKAFDAFMRSTILVSHDCMNIILDYWYDQTVSIWAVGRTPQPPIQPTITICMNTRTEQIPETWRKNTGLLCTDEAHNFATQINVLKMLSFETDNVVTVTATTNRDDGHYNTMIAFTGPHTKVVRLLDIPFKVIKYKTHYTPPVEYNKQGTTDWSKYVKALDGHQIRTARLLSYFLREFKGQKALIVTRETKTCDIIYDLVKRYEPSSAIFYKSDKTYQDSNILISPIGKVRDAFDAASTATDYDGNPISVILLWNTIKSELSFTQVFGRSCRAAMPTVICVVDNSPIAKRHWRVMNEFFVKYNGQLTEIDDREIQ